jgi:hypothetical protein
MEGVLETGTKEAMGRMETTTAAMEETTKVTTVGEAETVRRMNMTAHLPL